MDHNDFSLSLTRHTLPSVLLFEGEEEHLKQDALFALRKALLPEGMEEMNELVLDDPSADELIAAAETIPFMADKRLVIIRDYPPLTGRAEADENITLL